MKYTEVLQMIKTAESMTPAQAFKRNYYELGQDPVKQMRLFEGVLGGAQDGAKIWGGIGGSAMNQMNRLYNGLPSDLSPDERLKMTSAAFGSQIGTRLRDRVNGRQYPHGETSESAISQDSRAVSKPRLPYNPTLYKSVGGMTQYAPFSSLALLRNMKDRVGKMLKKRTTQTSPDGK